MKQPDMRPMEAASEIRMESVARGYAGARVTVVGLGREGLAVTRVLAAEGAHVTVSDRRGREALAAELDALAALPGIRYALDDGGAPRDIDALLAGCDLLVLSPGVDKRLPLVREAVRRGIALSSETALFFSRCPAPIIGVTGSAGKTTTTTLIGAMLRRGPRPVFVGGNIGQPLLERLGEIPPDAWVVLELSSFQLEGLRMSPAIAVVTNLTPNHLDRHETMDAYAEAKASIVAHQTARDIVVLNRDDARCVALASRTPARVLYFSLTSAVSDGAFLDTGNSDGAWLMLARGGSPMRLCRDDELSVPGRHNVANTLAAAAVAAARALPLSAIHTTITEFRGVPHRLQPVGTHRGVTYYDDSIATAPERTLAALAAINGTSVLILGGRDKHLPWDGLARVAVQRCRAVVLIGEAADGIRRHLEHALAEVATAHDTQDAHEVATEQEQGRSARMLQAGAIVTARDMADAVRHAAALARPGDNVLLSPGCASYDMYRDFAARGDAFTRAVGRLSEDG